MGANAEEAADAADDKAVQVLTPSHTIKFKVKKGGPGAVTKALLEETDRSLIENLSDQYKDWVCEDLNNMEAVLKRLESRDGERPELVEELRDIVHETRGMGGTFDYDLISAIGDQLYRLCDHDDGTGPGRLVAMRLHLDAMKVVINEEIKNDGGERGQEVMAGLVGVYEKYA